MHNLLLLPGKVRPEGSFVGQNLLALGIASFVSQEISIGETGGNPPAISANSTDILIVWNRPAPDQRLTGRLIDSETSCLESEVDLSGTGLRGSPSTSTDEERFIVSWRDGRAGEAATGRFAIYATRISESGVPLDPDGIRLATEDRNGAPKLVTRPWGTDVVWHTSTETGSRLFGASIHDDSPTAPHLLAETVHLSGFALASLGTRGLITWGSACTSECDWQLSGAYLTPAFEVEPMFSVQRNAVAPVVASHGSRGVLAWIDRSEGDQSHKVGLTLLDGERFSEPRFFGSGTNNSFEPSVAFDGETALVCWTEALLEAAPRRLLCSIGPPDGEMESLEIPAAMNAFATAVGNGRFALAYLKWTENLNAPYPLALRFVSLTPFPDRDCIEGSSESSDRPSGSADEDNLGAPAEGPGRSGCSAILGTGAAGGFLPMLLVGHLAGRRRRHRGGA